MNKRYISLPLLAGLTFVALNGFADADGSAEVWLNKMGKAAQQLSYRGVFVYQHDSQLESMEITHRVVNGETQEKLLSLNGSPREIIRNNDQVKCFLPDEKSVVVEHRKTSEKSFPSLLPENLAGLKENYHFFVGSTERVADRTARKIIIKPRDQFRYGYRLWADENTGLLLKSDLTNADGESLEQFMFTHVSIGVDIKAESLAPRAVDESMVWHSVDKKDSEVEGSLDWIVDPLPRGFLVKAQMLRIKPMQRTPLQHLVLSDGLAAVSVFIEPEAGQSGDRSSSVNSMGAVNAFMGYQNGHKVTVVGEVPEKTVRFIGQNLKRRQ